MKACPGPLAPAIQAARQRLREAEAVRRLWARDHTLWRPEPREIADRLGWLEAPEAMQGYVPELEAFAEEAAAECTDTLLLGMGGSSLGAEALREAYGASSLTILDSTVPSRVARTARRLDPRRTLVLAASKSGTTVEVSALAEYFWSWGGEKAADRFAALTDPGTPLEDLARRRGFRRLFTNRPDVGGRFSVLTLFGLLPAALAGVAPGPLLEAAGKAAARTRPEVPFHRNRACELAAWLGGGAAAGRWKLTLWTSPSLAGFGLWLEQLLAESTGKEGRGILPVLEEPPAPPAAYGPDRLFVGIGLRGEQLPAADHLEALARAGEPVLRLTVPSPPALGAAFFQWEAATALAGHLLGVHPFDQPDVEAAKVAAREALAALRAGRTLAAPALDPGDLLRAADRKGYVALQLYADETPELLAAVQRLRALLLRRFGLTTTYGFGPRYLHSTGQLHKGGPPRGVFLQVLETGRGDLEVPEAGFTFGALAAAQAAGDRQALAARGRPVAVLAAADPAAALTELAARWEP